MVMKDDPLFKPPFWNPDISRIITYDNSMLIKSAPPPTPLPNSPFH